MRTGPSTPETPPGRSPGPLLLGVDVGTTRTKAALIDADGREVASAAVATPFVSEGERVEMDVEALRHCLGEVLAGLGDARRRVEGVGVAGMAESGAPLDASRRPVGPVIGWHDVRGQEAVSVLERHFDGELALRIGQPVRTVLSAAKLGWLVDHGTTGVDRWLGVPELALHALTGAEATDFSLAARTGCYDVVERDWIPEVGEVLGFPVSVFAPLRPAGSAMGRVSGEGAAWSGLPEGARVTIAGHDHLAGMAGAGVRGGDAANSVGTAETLVVRCSSVPDLSAALDLRVAVTVHPAGREWAALVSAARAGLVLQGTAARLGRALADLDDLAGEHDPAEVAAETIDALASDEDTALPDASPGAIWAGVLEALAARTAEAYERLVRLVGPPERVVVFGGGSASDAWLRAKAARLSAPLWRSTVADAVARGAALAGGVAAGWWPSVDDAPQPDVSRRVD